MLCRATQDGQLIVNNSNKIWSPGGENDNTLQYSYVEKPMDSMKRQKFRTLEDEPTRSEGVPYATGQEWRAITNSSKKTEMAGKKRKRRSAGRIWL